MPSGFSIGRSIWVLVTGTIAASAAEATPGTLAAAWRTRSNKAPRSAAETALRCALTRHDQDGIAIEPERFLRKRRERPHEQPRGATSTSDSATWTTTNALPNPNRASPRTIRVESRSASVGLASDARSAGTQPNSTATPTATSVVKSSTRQSIGEVEVNRVGRG